MADVGRFLEGPHHVFDEVTRSIFKLYTSVPVTEVTTVLADVTMDPSDIPAPQVEDVVDETSVPVTDVGIQSVQSNLTAPDAVEIVGVSPSHKL